MKLLIEVTNKDNLYIDNVDGIILPLKDYSVESITYYTMKEIEEIINKSKNEVFIKLNKNYMNEDIDNLKEILLHLDKLKVKGVFFYDLAILQLKKELSLNIDLIWNQTHMVNNYNTCNYYYSHGVNYALLGKEITLEEIEEIVKNSKISTMVEVISRPSVAFSKRKLITNYYKDMGINPKNNIIINEKITYTNYHLIEDNNGTCFYLDTITNGCLVIKDLYDMGVDYIIIREFGLEEYFKELVSDTIKYISNRCNDSDYINKYKKLGDSTNFFFRKTIYKVKKNG